MGRHHTHDTRLCYRLLSLTIALRSAPTHSGRVPPRRALDRDRQALPIRATNSSQDPQRGLGESVLCQSTLVEASRGRDVCVAPVRQSPASLSPFRRPRSRASVALRSMRSPTITLVCWSLVILAPALPRRSSSLALGCAPCACRSSSSSSSSPPFSTDLLPTTSSTISFHRCLPAATFFLKLYLRSPSTFSCSSLWPVTRVSNHLDSLAILS